MIDLTFTAIYLLLGIPLIIVELIGVFRRQRGDTISENIWWLQRRFWPARLFVGGFCAWLFIHFVFDGRFM